GLLGGLDDLDGLDGLDGLGLDDLLLHHGGEGGEPAGAEVGRGGLRGGDGLGRPVRQEGAVRLDRLTETHERLDGLDRAVLGHRLGAGTYGSAGKETGGSGGDGGGTGQGTAGR